ncbi:hypothetical protein [Streptococcus halotolerans]|nr:hypothetical protein [Streptococcus halotolerans]
MGRNGQNNTEALVKIEKAAFLDEVISFISFNSTKNQLLHFSSDDISQ